MAARKAVAPSDDAIEDIELEVDVTDRVLEQTPERVLKFILATRRHPHIYKLLFVRGYSASVAREAWQYIDRLGGFDARGANTEGVEATADEKQVAKAMSDIDAWDEPHFGLIDTSLRRRFPEQHKFLFAGDLKPKVGPLSVASVRTMVSRLDELEDSAARKATRKEDRAALDLLAKRGIDKTERTKVLGWLAIVGDHKDDLFVGSADTDAAEALTETHRRNTLIKLREWFEEWSGVARVAIKRKRDRMHLGLARQKRGKGDAVEEEAIGEPEGDQG